MDDKSVNAPQAIEAGTDVGENVADIERRMDALLKERSYWRSRTEQAHRQVVSLKKQVEELETAVKQRDFMLERQGGELHELQELKPLLGVAIARRLLTDHLGTAHHSEIREIDEQVSSIAASAYREIAASVGTSIQVSLASARHRLAQVHAAPTEVLFQLSHSSDPAQPTIHKIINDQSMTKDYR